jgi:outer membrane cobalamin receptor
MSIDHPAGPRLRLAFLLCFSHQSQFCAGGHGPGADIVLTPGRSPQAIARSGSAVTVIRQRRD